MPFLSSLILLCARLAYLTPQRLALIGIPPLSDRMFLLGGILVALAVLAFLLNGLRRHADSGSTEKDPEEPAS